MINIRGELKFFDILEEVKKEEQTTIETLLA
jgi:predicted DNA-binding ribbon-helix-helix protein